MPVEAADTFVAEYQNLPAQGATGCDSSYEMFGWEPSAPDSYPVFVYLTGTGEPYRRSTALLAVKGMAERGFVAATVDYPDDSFGGCGALSPKSKCVFDPDSPTSAVSTLCDRPKADCSRGIVAAGYSQGSVLSMLSRDYDTRVRAVHGMGAGIQYSIFDLRGCLSPDTRTLSSERLRIVNGEEDIFVGEGDLSEVDTSLPIYLGMGDPEKVRAQSEELTGLSCGDSAYRCFRGESPLDGNRLDPGGVSHDRARGSGWYMVQAHEIEDDTAGHCYMLDNGCLGNPGEHWANGDTAWTLNANLDWLASWTRSSGDGGACLVERQGVPEPVERGLRTARDTLLRTAPGRWFTVLYYRL